MRPPWIEIDEQEAAERKARVLAKMDAENTDQAEDMAREEAYHTLIEDTGNVY